MGSSHSRMQYYNSACRAYDRALRLYPECGAPRPTGALIAYVEGQIDGRRLWRNCTYLEVNEMARLEPHAVETWIDENERYGPCDVSTLGACTAPVGSLHIPICSRFRPLPHHIAVMDQDPPHFHGGIPSGGLELNEDDAISEPFSGFGREVPARHQGGRQGYHDEPHQGFGQRGSPRFDDEDDLSETSSAFSVEIAARHHGDRSGYNGGNGRGPGYRGGPSINHGSYSADDDEDDEYGDDGYDSLSEPELLNNESLRREARRQLGLDPR